MFLAIFKETAKKIVRNKKNRLMLILSVIGLYFMHFGSFHNENVTVDKDQIELETYAEYGRRSRGWMQGISRSILYRRGYIFMAKREYELNLIFENHR